jgi:hypothetical protein
MPPHNRFLDPVFMQPSDGERHADLKRQRLKSVGLDKKQLLWPGWH